MLAIVISNFPPSLLPYPLKNLDGFLVNMDGEFIALSVRPPHPPFADKCQIFWSMEQDRFHEPCGGSNFAFDGSLLSGPSPSDMYTFPLRIEGDEIWVETTTLMSGTPKPGNPAGTPIRVTPPD